jgi:hypothetical protein
MKRFRRYIFNGLTVLSLLLAVATAGLWVRSLFSLDRYAFVPIAGVDQIQWIYVQYWGGMQLHRIHISAPNHDAMESELVSPGLTSQAMENPNLFSRVLSLDSGFDFNQRTRRRTGALVTYSYLCSPHWAVVAILSALPVSRGYLRLRSACGNHRGHCPACGYDIRANPGRCSECGHEPTPA